MILVLKFYVAIGAAVGLLMQVTIFSAGEQIFDRVLGFLLGVVFWPAVVVKDRRHLFSFKRAGGRERNPLDDHPPLYGGDGLAPDRPVIVNCASMGMAAHLMERFVEERHGKQGSDWKPGIAMTLASSVTACGMVRRRSITTKDGAVADYYFDLSRPVAGEAKLIEQLMR